MENKTVDEFINDLRPITRLIKMTLISKEDVSTEYAIKQIKAASKISHFTMGFLVQAYEVLLSGRVKVEISITCNKKLAKIASLFLMQASPFMIEDIYEKYSVSNLTTMINSGVMIEGTRNYRDDDEYKLIEIGEIKYDR